MKIHDFTDMKEEGHSKFEWDLMIDTIQKHVCNIPKWVYYHFLEVLPPIYCKEGFMCSEAVDHNRFGELIYYYFVKLEGVYYACLANRQTQEFTLKLIKETLQKEKVQE